MSDHTLSLVGTTAGALVAIITLLGMAWRVAYRVQNAAVQVVAATRENTLAMADLTAQVVELGQETAKNTTQLADQGRRLARLERLERKEKVS